MKIHGTLKGGALSKKEFGVCGTPADPTPSTVCYNADNINTYYEYRSTTDTNLVIGAYIDTTDNPVYNVDVTAIAIYIYAESGLSGGEFALGVWDSDGDLKNESSTFTVADMPVGTSPNNPTEKITRTITSTTIEEDDTIGIICKTAPTGSGDVANGGYDSASSISNWKRTVFIQGVAPTVQDKRTLVICVNE